LATRAGALGGASLQVGDAPLEGFQPLEHVVESCPERGGTLDRFQGQGADRADDLASVIGEEQLETAHARGETIELSAQDWRDDVGDPSLHVAGQGLRLTDQGLAATCQHVPERSERAARAFHAISCRRATAPWRRVA
jgi:hypothetical protein